MASAKNELPTFGKNAELDESIVDNTSGLKDTGFQPNTTIKSAEMNTYMKMLINGMSGLIDSVYDSGVSQGNINAKSSAEDIKNYIKTGLNHIIKTSKVDNATHATSADKLQTARNITIAGDATGSTSFDGSSDVAINVKSTITNAKSMVDSSGSPLTVGNLQRPVYFSNGVPAECNLYENVGTYDMTKESNGTFSLKTLSDKTHFLAYVEIYNDSNTFATGIAEFNLGVMQSDLTGVCIYSNTATYAFVNTNAYGDVLHSKAVVAKMQAIHDRLVDGSIVTTYNDSSAHHIKITKIAQLAVSVNPMN